MTFRGLKSYMPRSLYGRAFLILLLPVLSVLLVVSVVFVQRHFEGVTRQMALSVSREVRLLLADEAATAEQIGTSEVARTLLIRVQPVSGAEVPQTDEQRWFDLTAGVVIRELRRLLPDIEAVGLPDEKTVLLYVARGDGVIRLDFDRRRVSASNPHQLPVNVLVIGILMTIVSYLYLRNQLRPITRLARAAEAFGRGSHVTYRPAGATEVRAAGSAFVDMRARIERQIEQRTLMLSGVSHDMRTPLTRLKLGLSMLDDEESAAMLHDVEDMQRLLDEFLDFARGASEGEPEPTDPIALVRQVVEDFQRSEVPVALVQVEGEGELPLRPGGIRRAVENLVGNAVRYGTKAEVSVLLSEKSLRIWVEDDGSGIPAEKREEAMKPFARLEPARNQNCGAGVGLGLAITMDIARAHGGVVRLSESQRLGGLRADIVIGR